MLTFTSPHGLHALVKSGFRDFCDRPRLLDRDSVTSSSLVKVEKRTKRTSAVSQAEYLASTPDCLINQISSHVLADLNNDSFHICIPHTNTHKCTSEGRGREERDGVLIRRVFYF